MMNYWSLLSVEGANDVEGILTYLILILVLIFAGILFLILPFIYPVMLRQLKKVKIGIRAFIHKKGINEENQYKSIHDEIEMAGYSYDPEQDVFYSTYNAWQKTFGYCRLYDEAAAPFGLIIDCEPITFEYQNKKWLIEFWKGQYDLTTGAEIGVYTCELSKLDIPNLFEGYFYQCAEEEDQLNMSFTLFKNGRKLFERTDNHWWLTGFKLGEFTEPSELSMEIRIDLKDDEMCYAFINGMLEVNYDIHELEIQDNSVYFVFDKARTPQPITRTGLTDWIIQRKNEQMCIQYQEITKPYSSLQSKANAVHSNSPALFGNMINMGKKQQVYDVFYSIQKYLSE